MATTQVARPSTDDLWKAAMDQLSEEDKKLVGEKDKDNKRQILLDLKDLTTKSKDENVKKRWKWTKKNGETVIFVDQFSKIAKWVDRFIAVGDNAVQYDPGHAALPWAAVRFLLKIAVNDIGQFGSVVEGVASVAEIIYRSKIVEDTYLGSSTTAADELQRALIKLYAAIMIYLSKSKSYFGKTRRLQSGIFPDLNAELCFDAIAAAQVDVDRCSNIVAMQDLSSIKDGLDLSKRQNILRLISKEPYSKHHKLAKKEVLSGTGKWLLSDPIFNKWKEESVSSILWLHGSQGSGKSKLVSIVIDDAIEAFHSGHRPAPAYFYCSRNTAEPTRAKPDAIVASIVRQLSCLQPGDPLLPPAVTAYEQREMMDELDSESIERDEGQDLIIQFTKRYSVTTIVIDAIDECNREELMGFLDTLKSIVEKSLQLVKIFISSRDQPDIEEKLKDVANIKLSAKKNGDDISLFVNAETQRLIDKRLLLAFSQSREKLKTEIIDYVSRNADGMFRWASLKLQSLCLAKSDDAIRYILWKQPESLEALYLEIYQLTQNSNDVDREIAIYAFSWLLCSQKKLEPSEFLAAISTSPRRRFNDLTIGQILGICRDMVIFDPELNTFRFAHLSVREFLEKQPEYTTTTKNALAAETCLFNLLNAAKDPATKRFLSRESFATLSSSPEFSHYSVIYWGPHCQLAGNPRKSNLLTELFLQFLSSESELGSAYESWDSIIRNPRSNYLIPWELERKYYDASATKQRGRFIAACFDLQEISTIDGILDGEIVNNKGNNLLEVALKHDSCEAVAYFIKDSLISITENIVKATASYLESNNEMSKSMRLLLEQPNLAVTEETAKFFAELLNREAMVLLLRLRGEDIRITSEVVRAAMGNENHGREVVALLLEQRGAEISITEELLVDIAEDWKHGYELMEVIFEQQRADIKITEGVLVAGALNPLCGTQILTLMLKHRGADIEITERVLEAVASNPLFRGGILKLLLEHRGEDVVITEGMLNAVASNSLYGRKILELLLEQRGVIITQKALVAAASSIASDAMALLIMLLEHQEADIEITEELLVAAASNPKYGKEILVFLYWQQGDIAITEAVLKAAISNHGCGTYILPLLLNKRADMPITEAVLVAAASSHEGDEKLTMLLKKQREDISISGGVLEAAASNYNCGKKILKLLLKQQRVVITEKVLVAAASCYDGGENLKVLLEKQREDISISEGVLEAAISNHSCGREILELLLKQREVVITERVLVAAASDLKWGKQKLAFLHLQRGGDIAITQAVLEAAASNKEQGTDILALIQGWERHTTRKTEAAKAEITNEGILE